MKRGGREQAHGAVSARRRARDVLSRRCLHAVEHAIEPSSHRADVSIQWTPDCFVPWRHTALYRCSKPWPCPCVVLVSV